MFCAKCGSPNDDNAFRCTQCGEVMLRGRAQGMDQDGLGPAKPRLAQSIIVTILCCMPLGIPAIVYSSMTMGKNAEGDFRTAHRCSRLANTWGWVSFGLGLVAIVCATVLNLVAAGTHP